MFRFLINMLSGDRDYAGSREENGSPPHVTEQKEDSISIPDLFKDDVNALKQEFGKEFRSGNTITLTLTRALEIMPRKRQRTDAYTLLTRWLYDSLDIKLIIKSRKKK